MKKTERIEFVATKPQFDAITERAKKLGFSRGDYCLFCTLNAQIKCEIGNDIFERELEIIERRWKEGFITKEQCSRMIDNLILRQENTLKSTGNFTE